MRTQLKSITQLHTKVPSVLRNRILAKVILGGVRVTFVEQVVKTDGSLQPAEHVFGKQRGVRDKETSHEHLLYRLPATDFLSFETGEKFFGQQRSDDIDLSQVSRGIA